MLVHFSVSNFWSIKDEAVLSMVPAKSRGMKDHIITDNEGKKFRFYLLLVFMVQMQVARVILSRQLNLLKN